MADVVIAVAIDTMYLLFESVNQISDVEFFFLEKHIDRCLLNSFKITINQMFSVTMDINNEYRRCGKNNILEMTLFYTTFVFHHKILTYYF